MVEKEAKKPENKSRALSISSLFIFKNFLTKKISARVSTKTVKVKDTMKEWV